MNAVVSNTDHAQVYYRIIADLHVSINLLERGIEKLKK